MSKRLSILFLGLVVIISSCDSTGTSSVQKSIDKKDYPKLVNLCEKYKDKPEKSIAVEMGLEALSDVYGDQLISKKYFTDILRRSESEPLLVGYAVASILSNCDTISFLNLMKKREPFPGNSYLKSAFEKHSIAKSCDRMDQFLSVLSSINYAIDDTIKYSRAELDTIDAQSLVIGMAKDNVSKRVEEMSAGRQYYFYVVAANTKSAYEKQMSAYDEMIAAGTPAAGTPAADDDNEYEVVPMKKDMEFLVNFRYSQLKGSEDLKANMFEKRHALLLTDSKDIGKGLYRFYAYKSGTKQIETTDGFTQDWDVLQHVEYDEWNSLKEQVVKYEADLQELEVSRASIESLIEKLELEKQGYSQLF